VRESKGEITSPRLMTSRLWLRRRWRRQTLAGLQRRIDTNVSPSQPGNPSDDPECTARQGVIRPCRLPRQTLVRSCRLPRQTVAWIYRPPGTRPDRPGRHSGPWRDRDNRVRDGWRWPHTRRRDRQPLVGIRRQPLIGMLTAGQALVRILTARQSLIGMTEAADAEKSLNKRHAVLLWFGLSLRYHRDNFASFISR
jgi:hypothetical protein